MAKNDNKNKKELAAVVWINESKEVLKSFPTDVRKALGEDLYRVQSNVKPKDFKSVSYTHLTLPTKRIV